MPSAHTCAPTPVPTTPEPTPIPTSCDAGFILLNGASCVACPCGKYASTGECADCSIGRYATSNRSEFCTAAPRSTYVDAEGQCNVTACQTGQHTVSIATNSSAGCLDTAAGYYLHNRTLKATLCPAGRLSSSINSLYCSLCGVGKYSSMGASSCSLCQEGRYQADPGQSSCDLCPYG